MDFAIVSNDAVAAIAAAPAAIATITAAVGCSIFRLQTTHQKSTANFRAIIGGIA